MELEDGKLSGAQVQAEPTAGTSARIKGGATKYLTDFFFGLLYALMAYALGGAVLPFGARPLGIALLCGSDRRVLYCYAGLCVAAWQSEGRVLLIGVYTAALLIRLLIRFTLDTPWKEREGQEAGEKTVGEVFPLLFSEQLRLRMATAGIAAFAVGIWRLVEGGFLYYDLYGTLLSVIVAPVAVLLMGGLFTKQEVGIHRYLCGLLALSAALAWSIRDLKLYGISLSALLCMLTVLYVCRKYGAVAGIVAGTVCGLAASIQYAPLFAFVGLCAGLLFPISVVFGTFAAFSVGLAWGGYVSGIGVLNGLLPALLAGAVLFAVLDKLFWAEQATHKEAVAETETESESADTVSVVCEPFSPLSLDGLRLTDTNRRIKELCQSFASLSEIFYGVSRTMQKPADADLRQICDSAFDASCATCSQRNDCWGARYHVTSGEVGRLAALLHRNGRLETHDADEALSERCVRLPDIVEEINHNAAQHQRQLLQGDRTEVFAMDYAALSDLLAAAMTAGQDAFEVDAEAGARVCRELSDEALGVCGACVLRGRRRRVTACGAEGQDISCRAEQIRLAAEKGCGFPLAIGQQYGEGGQTVLEFEEREALSVLWATRSHCARGEEQYCGDTTGVFRSSDGRLFALISDGMGAGKEAALTSGLCGLFLKRMLGIGASCETVLRMLNGFLRNRGSGSLHECSATVDLMEMDLIHSRAAFYKSGAAPSYMFRNGSLFKLRSHTVPIGILRDPDTRRIELDVGVGDLVVMVSDGVTQGKEECPWLFDLLRSQGEDVSPDRLADLIVKYAKGEGSTDDLSVLVLKITGAEEKKESDLQDKTA